MTVCKPNIDKKVTDSIPSIGVGLDGANLLVSQKLSILRDFVKNRKKVQVDGERYTINYVPTKDKCQCQYTEKHEESKKSTSQHTKTVNGKFYKCMPLECPKKGQDGCYWHYASEAVSRPRENKVRPTGNTETIDTNKSVNRTRRLQGLEDCEPTPKPRLVCRGKFASWLTEEKYPDIENSECKPIYGDKAGKSLQLFRVPSVAKLRHFYAARDGVPNKYEPGNDERRGAYVYMVGLYVKNVKTPKKTPKPLNKNNPFSVMMVERTEHNKTVMSSGNLLGCFEGLIGNESFAVPRHGMNSPEYYDAHLNPPSGGTLSNSRKGQGELSEAVYVYHSPDTHFRRPSTDVSWCLHEGDVFGSGFRHGLWEEGEVDNKFLQGSVGQKGARQSINLSRFTSVGDSPDAIPVRALGYAQGNQIGSMTDRFTFPLLNLGREATTYVELDRDPNVVAELQASNIPVEGALGGGDSSRTDASFIGDTVTHERTLEGYAHYVTFIRNLPRQYGSVVNQVYVPMGIELGSHNVIEEGLEPLDGENRQDIHEAEGLCGDSFVNYHNYKRSSIVSDKVFKMISIQDTGIDLGFLESVPFIGTVFKWLFRVLNIRECGYLPQNGDDNPVSINGGLGTRNGDGKEDNTDDIYHAHLQKTDIFGWFNTDVNVRHRITRDPELNQIHSKRLKGRFYDSSFPFGANWLFSYINRHFMKWTKPAGYKELMMFIFNFLWVYGIGLWIFFKGAVIMGNAVVGTSTSVFAIILGILIIVGFSLGWMILWVNTDWDNKLIANYLGIDLCYPDRKWRSGNVFHNSSRYAMRLGRIEDYVDNHFEVDSTHSRVNEVDITLGLGPATNTQCCPEERDGRVYFSRSQDPGSYIDYWKNFDTSHYTDIPADAGAIKKIFSMGGRPWIHTTDRLFGMSIQEIGENIEVRHDLYEGAVEGYAGLEDPNAAYVTAFGYFFPDRKARKWYRFRGSSAEPISERGLSKFFNDNMGMELVAAFPNYKNVDLKTGNGVGYSFGIDYEHDRIIFTKKDYRPLKKGITLSEDGWGFEFEGDRISTTDVRYFCDISYTVSYHIPTEQFVSFHYYTPSVYAWNRHDMYSFDTQGMWKHNAKGSHQMFYGQYRPMSVDFVTRDYEYNRAFDYNSSIADVESYVWDNYDYRWVKRFFDNISVWNNHQNSGVLRFEPKELSISEASTEDNSRVLVKHKQMDWQYSDLVDKLIDPNRHMFLNDCSIGPKLIDPSNISKKTVTDKLCDKFLTQRYLLNSPEEDRLKIFLKSVRNDSTIT